MQLQTAASALRILGRRLITISVYYLLLILFWLVITDTTYPNIVEEPIYVRFMPYNTPSGFNLVNIDLVSPLPPSRGCS